MTPVPALIVRPAGRPVAENVSVWPSGSLAETATPATVSPSVLTWLAAAITTGRRLTSVTRHVKARVTASDPSLTATFTLNELGLS